MAASFAIKAKSNALPLSREIRRAARDQMPFAVARALTLAGNDVARDVGARIERHMTVRSKGLKRALQSTRAQKRDWPRTQAVVHLRTWAEFLAIHVEGGIKRPQKGARNVAVPTRLVRHTKKGKVTKRHKPRQLIDAGGKFAAIGGESVVFRPATKRGKGKRVGIYYTLHRRVRIRATWRARADAANSVRRTYSGHLRASLDRALASRRA